MSTVKSVVVCTDYHKQVSLRRNFSKHDFSKQDTRNPKSHLATGSTNGALLVSRWSWTILALSTSVQNMSNTYYKYSNKTTKSKKTGKELATWALPLTGTTRNEKSICPCLGMSKKH